MFSPSHVPMVNRKWRREKKQNMLCMAKQSLCNDLVSNKLTESSRTGEPTGWTSFARGVQGDIDINKFATEPSVTSEWQLFCSDMFTLCDDMLENEDVANGALVMPLHVLSTLKVMLACLKCIAHCISSKIGDFDEQQKDVIYHLAALCNMKPHSEIAQAMLEDTFLPNMLLKDGIQAANDCKLGDSVQIPPQMGDPDVVQWKPNDTYMLATECNQCGAPGRANGLCPSCEVQKYMDEADEE